MSKEQSFTSTGIKILHHTDAIEDLRNGKNHPIVLHIMPTELCNLRCEFCSVAQRGTENKLFPDLTLEQIDHVVSTLIKMGLKAVILSGGGDPVLYKQINELIEYLHDKNLEIGLITNGILLEKKIQPQNIELLDWIRISINSLDYIDDIDIPKLNKKTVLGFSYIWNTLTTLSIIDRIKNKIKEQLDRTPVSYVRMLPDCNLETSDLENSHIYLKEITRQLGDPFFHQYKTHKTPKECHLGRVHPVLYTDGFIYPCDSIVLNCPTDNKKFNQDYALCKWNKIEEFYSKWTNGSLINTEKCPHCVFNRQNELLMEVINTNNKLPQIYGEIQHVNFI